MKSCLLTLSLSVICLFTSLQAAQAADTYSLEPSHTSVVFGVSHMGLSYTYGRFNQVAGTYTLDTDDPSASKFELLINVESIDTNDEKRDQHLRGADFFSANEFPTITFQSKQVEVKQDEANNTVYHVTGDLTMHGTTQSVTIPLRLLGEGKGMSGEARTGFLTETRLKRSDFGMTNMIPAIGDEVAITISFEGVKK